MKTLSSLASPRLQAALLTTLTWAGLAHDSHGQLLTNPGFESDFAGWTPNQNLGTAIFSISTTSPYAGAKAARVEVSAPGSGAKPALTGSFASTPNTPCLLRFFARSEGVNRPLMKVQLSSITGQPQIDIKPSTNGWEEYHFAFTPTLATTTLSITFEQAATFWLDEVQVHAAGDTKMDVPLSHLWKWGQYGAAAGNAKILTGTDNCITVRLPDERVCWFFNDTWVGAMNADRSKFYSNERNSVTLYRNYALVQQDDTLTPLVNNTLFRLDDPLNEDTTPATDATHLYWPTDAFVEGNQVKVLLNKIKKSPLSDDGKAIATLSLPTLALQHIRPRTNAWGVRVLSDADGYFYIYHNDAGVVRIARVLKGSFSDESQWTYYTGSTWTSSASQAAALPLLTGVSVAERLGPENYTIVSIPAGGDVIHAQFAPSPTGPWTTKAIIADPDQEAISYFYMPCLHKHSAQNGVYSLSYSDNGSCGADGAGIICNRVLADMCHYSLQHLKSANLLDLSPDTVNLYSDTFSDNDASEWMTFGGTWSTTAGQFSVTSGAGHKALLKGVVASDFSCEADVKAGSGSGAGLIFRTRNIGKGPEGYEGYYAALKPGVGVVYGKNYGTGTLLQQQVGMTIQPNFTYRLKVVATGSTFQIYVDNVLRITATDGMYADGGLGLRNYNSTATWDNVVVTPATVTGEVESLVKDASSSDPDPQVTNAGASLGAYREYQSNASGDYVVYRLNVPTSGEYRVELDVHRGSNRGRFGLAVASTPGGPFVNVGDQNNDLYATSSDFVTLSGFGNVSLTSGTKYFKFTVTGKNPSSTSYRLGLDVIRLMKR